MTLWPWVHRSYYEAWKERAIAAESVKGALIRQLNENLEAIRFGTNDTIRGLERERDDLQKKLDHAADGATILFKERDALRVSTAEWQGRALQAEQRLRDIGMTTTVSASGAVPQRSFDPFYWNPESLRWESKPTKPERASPGIPPRSPKPPKSLHGKALSVRGKKAK